MEKGRGYNARHGRWCEDGWQGKEQNEDAATPGMTPAPHEATHTILDGHAISAGCEWFTSLHAKWRGL